MFETNRGKRRINKPGTYCRGAKGQTGWVCALLECCVWWRIERALPSRSEARRRRTCFSSEGCASAPREAPSTEPAMPSCDEAVQSSLMLLPRPPSPSHSPSSSSNACCVSVEESGSWVAQRRDPPQEAPARRPRARRRHLRRSKESALCLPQHRPARGTPEKRR